MNAQNTAALVFRFAGIFLLLAVLPNAIPESAQMLYYSARFGSYATTGSHFGYLHHLWPVIGIGIALAMLVCSRSLGRMIAKGL